MNIVILQQVKEFLDALEPAVRTDIARLVLLLEQCGHELSMPYAKPIGKGLWELRRTGHPQIRILYGFSRGSAFLLLALKKQRSALRQEDIQFALKRFRPYCE